MDSPVLMSVDTRHFTQSGLERSVTESPGSSGTSSTPSVTHTSAIDIANPLLAKRSNKLTSFVAALNNRDYTGSRINPKGERRDTPTVSALVPIMDASPIGCRNANSKGIELEGLGSSSDAAIRYVNRCFRQLDILDAGIASLSIKTNWAYWQLGKAYEAFCEVSRLRLFINLFCSFCLCSIDLNVDLWLPISLTFAGQYRQYCGQRLERSIGTATSFCLAMQADRQRCQLWQRFIEHATLSTAKATPACSQVPAPRRYLWNGGVEQRARSVG
jgi:hypothetical protein